MSFHWARTAAERDDSRENHPHIFAERRTDFIDVFCGRKAAPEVKGPACYDPACAGNASHLGGKVLPDYALPSVTERLVAGQGFCVVS